MTLPCKTGWTPRFGGLVVTAERGVLAERMDADVPAHLTLGAILLREPTTNNSERITTFIGETYSGEVYRGQRHNSSPYKNRTNFIGEKRPNFVGDYCNLPHSLSAFLPRWQIASKITWLGRIVYFLFLLDERREHKADYVPCSETGRKGQESRPGRGLCRVVARGYGAGEGRGSGLKSSRS